MSNLEIQISTHIAFIEIDDYIIAWNRFYPSMLKFKKEDFDQIIKLIADKSQEKDFDEDFLAYLKKNHFLADENYLEKYISESHAFLDECKTKMDVFRKQEEPFYSIQICNEECNLNCSYCIVKHTWGKLPGREKPKVLPEDEIYKRIIKLIDTQYEKMKKHSKEEFVFSINGGEFLLHYDMLKQVILYIRETKNDKKSKIAINSNGTLITDEIAELIVQNGVEIFISIDGNKTHHDTTRVYHNNKGSYDDVLNAIRLLKSHNYQNEKITFIQGTIDNFSEFDMDELSKMAEHGFESARLSVNLMDITPEESKQRAIHFFEIVKKSSDEKLKIYDSIFDNYKNAVDKGVSFRFWPFCNGLGGRASSSIMYNISDDSMSYLCQYATPAFFPAGEEIDAYNPALAERALDFIKNRTEAIIEKCKDCSIVGICRGGCIMDGLTFQNELNKTACAYQKALWALYIKNIYELKSSAAEKKES